MPKWYSASDMYATHTVENFKALLRKVLWSYNNGLKQ